MLISLRTQTNSPKQYAFADQLEEVAKKERRTDADSDDNLSPDAVHSRQSIMKSSSSTDVSGMVIVPMPWEIEESVLTQDNVDKPDVSASIYIVTCTYLDFHSTKRAL